MRKILMFLMFLFVTAVFAADRYDTWLNDEVKPIITKSEKDAFKKLKSDADKDKFIEDFWARRDPSPGTPENEYRKNYEEQLKIIADKLKNASKKPVDMDMGMTYLILGGGYELKEMPEATEEDELRQTWVYRHLPPGLASGEIEIAFKGDPEAGGFVFAESKKAKEILDNAREYYAHLSEKAANMQEEEKAKMEAAMAAADAMPSITTPEVRTALDAAVAGNLSSDVTITTLADSFMASNGDVFATFAIHSPADVSKARSGIRVVKSDGSMLKEGEFPFASAEEAPGHFQAGTPVKSGDYTVYFAVVAGGKTGSAKQELKVPNYSTGFALSSLILAKSFKQLPEAKPEKEPYTFGKIKVEPSTDRIFTKADDVIVVYEGYNFKMADGAANPTLEATFSFQHEQDAPKSTPPAPPNGLVTAGKKITVPTSYPLEKFPAGNYKLIVKVTDKATGESSTREARFTVK